MLLITEKKWQYEKMPGTFLRRTYNEKQNDGVEYD